MTEPLKSVVTKFEPIENVASVLRNTCRGYLRLFFASLLAASIAAAQSSPMTNQDILKMTKAGLSASVIVDKISSAPCRFNTSVEALASLKSSGVDDSVLSAMIRCRPAPRPHAKPHVWIGANEEWIAYSNHTTVATTNSNGTAGVATSVGNTTVQAHSEYPDVTRTLEAKCQGLVITGSPSDADYAVVIERYHAGHLLTQRNRYSIFRASDGNLVVSGTTTWLKNAAGDICKAILQDSPKSKSDEQASGKGAR